MGKRKVKKNVSAVNEDATTEAPAKAADVMPETTEKKESESVTLTIADLQAQSRIFELASTRGAFHANELSVVGSVVDKLNAFLKQVEESQKAAANDIHDGEGDNNSEDAGGTENVATNEKVSAPEEA